MNVMHVNLDDVLEFYVDPEYGSRGRQVGCETSAARAVWRHSSGQGDDSRVRVPCDRHGCRVRQLDRQLTGHQSCHLFVYDAMLCTKSCYALLYRPFVADTKLKIFDKAVEWSGVRATVRCVGTAWSATTAITFNADVGVKSSTTCIMLCNDDFFVWCISVNIFIFIINIPSLITK